jgi:ADP-ribose pyrophosphatase YjhB (NUDIX family)
MSNEDFIRVFDTPYFSVEASANNHDEENPYYRINTKDSVICCLMNSDDELLLAKQMRPNLGYDTIEFPAGALEDGESPIQAAGREIREELGFKSNLIYLGSYRLMMNRTINREHLFIGLASNEDCMPPEAGISLVKIPRKNYIDFINKNKIEQLAALGIIKLIDLKFNMDFMKDSSVLEKLWKKI